MIPKISVIEGEAFYVLNGEQEVYSFCFDDMSLLDCPLYDAIYQVGQAITNALYDEGKIQEEDSVFLLINASKKEYTTH